MAWLQVAASRCLPAAHWPAQVYMQTILGRPYWAEQLLGVQGSAYKSTPGVLHGVLASASTAKYMRATEFNSLAASLAYNTNCANTLWPQVPVTSHMLGDSTGHKARAPAAARSQHAHCCPQRHLTCLTCRLQLMRLESSCPVAAVQLVCV
jgi:hypothetical protein